MAKKCINNDKKVALLSSNNDAFRLRKKKRYRKFVRLIKDDYFENFTQAAKELNLNRETVARWFYTKPAQKALDELVDKFVAKIPRQRLTWRGHAKILELFD